mgnify:CR=1 FL=1
MSKLIMSALIAEADASETKAVANLQNYMSNSAGIGEHPDVVEECSKLVKEIAAARELRETVQSLLKESTVNKE